MPGPLLVAGVAAGANLLGQGINAASTSSMNKQTRRFNNWMYDKQREHALQDYNSQNEYNSPASQMARLKTAGLNPNLVYGNGNSVQNAAPVRSSDSGSWNPDAPQFNPGDAASAGLSAYYSSQIQQQNIDNLKAQNTVLLEEAALKEAQRQNLAVQTLNTAVQTSSTQFDYDFKSEIRDISLDAAKTSLAKQKADLTYTLDNNDRQSLLTANSLQNGLEDILTKRLNRAKTEDERQLIRAQIKNVKASTDLQELDANLKRNGIQPSDNLIFRVGAQFLATQGKTVTDAIKEKFSPKPSTQAGSLPFGRSSLILKRKK